MSKFEVKVKRILNIEKHPNADRLDIVHIDGYRSIVQSDTFNIDSLVVYIPEGAVLSSIIIERLGLEGKLAGKQQNRVKAIKLRSILSQGLIFPIELRKNVMDQDTHIFSDIYVLAIGECGAGRAVKEGDDVTEWLGITKYEPPIPIHMQGEVFNAFGNTLKYDVENIKKFPDIFKDGEEVCITEKLHGTWCCMGSHPEIDTPVVTSKGLSDKGLAFKFNAANDNNLYIRAFEATKDENGLTIIDRVCEELNILMQETPVYILGEIFGAGVQDLTYGGDKPQFRIFDIYVGEPTQGNYLAPHELGFVAMKIGVPTVPVLYVGEYSQGVVDHYTDGKETTSGKETHIREGVVINPMEERRDEELGRVFLKSVSEAYLLRRGIPTEFN